MALDGILNIIEGLTNLDTHAEVLKIVEANADSIIDFQQAQMYEGIGGDGEYIRPFYSEDPYFKKPGAALAYAQWKQRITPNPNRPLDVPNLFINGYFYKSLTAVFSDNVYSVRSKNNLGEKVFAEHPNAEGLSPKNSQEFAETITIPEFTKILDKILQ